MALALTGCAATPQSALNPDGTQAVHQLGLVTLSLWIMGGVAAVVAGVLLYVVIRYRERKGDNELPPQTHGNRRLEVVWTIIPILLIAIIAVPTVEQTYVEGKTPAAATSLPVTVVGHQFWWEFDYPSLGLKTADELHIPVGEKIRLSLLSQDVMHAFWVPRLSGKTDVIPGRDNPMWIEASKPGIYTGQCAQYCGVGHAEMKFVVVAQTRSAYNHWVQSMKHPVIKPQTALAKQGMTLFAQVGCSACHAIDGTSFTGNVGPNLTGYGSRLLTAGGDLKNTPANLATWLRNPPAVVPGSLMPDLHLSGAQIKALSAYLRGLVLK